MKRQGKDPFKNRAITLFVYNLGQINSSSSPCTTKEKLRQSGLHPFDKDLIDMLPVTNFGEILNAHFGEVKKSENHNNVFRDNYKIYYYISHEVETNFIEFMIVGKQAILEILELGRIYNWAVMSPDRNELIDLSSLPSYGYLSLDEYFGRA